MRTAASVDKENWVHVITLVKEIIVLEVILFKCGARVSVCYGVVDSAGETRAIFEMAEVPDVALDFTILTKLLTELFRCDNAQ